MSDTSTVQLLAVSFNYWNTPLELRERLAEMDGQTLRFMRLLNEVEDGGKTFESAVLVTCHRVEVYATTDNIVAARQLVIYTLSAFTGIDKAELYAHGDFWEGLEAAEHLIRVACGTESRILGEAQILGQVKSAYETAQSIDATGTILHRLFNHAIHAGKQTRSQTRLGRNPISIASIITSYLNAEFQGKNYRVLLIGTGELAQLIGKELSNENKATLNVCGRSIEHTHNLAHEIHATTLDWSKLWQGITQADVVICATSSPTTILGIQALQSVMKTRNDTPLKLLDLGIPRNVESGVNKINGIELWNLDALCETTTVHSDCITEVETIIAEESARFEEWILQRHITPIIHQLRGKLQQVAANELDATLSRLPTLDEHDRQLIQQLTHRIVNKVLHTPTLQLRRYAGKPDSEMYSELVRDLFALDEVLEQEAG